jgi:hypothetical protein
MEFVQVIEYETSKYDAVRAIGEEFTETRRKTGGPKPMSAAIAGVALTRRPTARREARTRVAPS